MTPRAEEALSLIAADGCQVQKKLGSVWTKPGPTEARNALRDVAAKCCVHERAVKPGRLAGHKSIVDALPLERRIPFRHSSSLLRMDPVSSRQAARHERLAAKLTRTACFQDWADRLAPARPWAARHRVTTLLSAECEIVPRMTDASAWIAAAIGAATLVVAVLAYRAQHKKMSLEYVVTVNARLLRRRLPRGLEIRHDGQLVDDATLSIIRIVNTGTEPIRQADFETPLLVSYDGVDDLVSAAVVATRPPDLHPRITIQASDVWIDPLLLNPGDMIECQVLSSGRAEEVTLGGRIAGLTMQRRSKLPYPPGSGAEGEMVGFDRFMWFVFTPTMIAGIGLLVAFNGDYTGLTQGLVLAVVALIVGVLYPLQVRYLIKRRRLWRA